MLLSATAPEVDLSPAEAALCWLLASTLDNSILFVIIIPLLLELVAGKFSISDRKRDVREAFDLPVLNTLGNMRSRISRMVGKQVHIIPTLTSTVDHNARLQLSHVGFVVLANVKRVCSRRMETIVTLKNRDEQVRSRWEAA